MGFDVNIAGGANGAPGSYLGTKNFGEGSRFAVQGLEEVLREQRRQAQKRVLLQRDHAVHAALELFGLRGGFQLILHDAGDRLHRLVLVAGHVGYERQPEEVLDGGGFEELAQVDRHVHADGAAAVAARHFGADGAHDDGDHERGHAYVQLRARASTRFAGEVVLEERGIGLVAPAFQAGIPSVPALRRLCRVRSIVEAVLGLLVV